MDPKADSAQGGSDGGDQGQERRYSKKEVSAIVRERVKEYQEEIANLSGGQQQQPTTQAQQPTVFTRAQLTEAVNQGTITETEALAILDRQQAEGAARTAQTVAQQTVENMTRNTTTQQSIDKYKAYDADLNIPGSDAYARVQETIKNQLQVLGQAESTPAVELLALQSIYGPETVLTQQEGRRATHQETGGGSDRSGGETPDGAPSGLTKRQVDYYQSRIDMGLYSDWDAVKEELSFEDKDLSRRAASR